MEQLLQIVDFSLIFLSIGLLITLLFQVFPKLNRLWARIQGNENGSTLSYVSNGKFWSWLFSKEGMIDILRDKKKHRVLYVNSFRFFNIFWKLLLVILTFRVLLIFFGQDILD